MKVYILLAYARLVHRNMEVQVVKAAAPFINMAGIAWQMRTEVSGDTSV